MAKQFTDANFDEEVLMASAEKPVLVDFFAGWCAPCMMQGPIVDEVSNMMGEKASVGKLDTESSSNTARTYGVMSIPTLLVFRNGEVVKQFVGVQSKDALINALNTNM
ncbi:thioredoxin [Patescibacteria group bacterium]|nr:thioredoxin [Patescibacteria group bacterium]